MCEVCGNTDKKYRCPTCLIYYCSKDCYGNHKSTCKKKNNSSEPASKKLCDPSPAASKESIYYEIPKAQLDALSHSEPLRQLLKNTHLRKLLKMIDDSPDPESIMHMAMQEPLFLEYVTVCMEETNMG